MCIRVMTAAVPDELAGRVAGEGESESPDDGDLGRHLHQDPAPVVGEIDLRLPALAEEAAGPDDGLHDDDGHFRPVGPPHHCLLYTSDAADDLTRVDLGGRRIIKKKKKK